MAKFIGVKMIEAVPMKAREANDKGHKIGNHSFEEDGYWEGLGFVLQWAKYGLKK